MIALHFVSENSTGPFAASRISLFQAHFTLSESAFRHVAALARQTVSAVGGYGKERTKMWSERQSRRFLAT
jgi:hypothetical protein